MRYYKTIFTLMVVTLMVIISPLKANAADSAQQILSKAVAKFRSQSGVKASFSLQGVSNGKGSLICVKDKFYVTAGGMSTWYNGKTMWSYNSKTSETTITTPTASELTEVNPFTFVSVASTQYKATMAKTQPSGSYALVLTPKSKKDAASTAVLTLNSKTLVPQKLVMKTSAGGRIVVTVTSYKVVADIAASTFEYPKSKYPKAEIVDLR
jgi:outer membrane lipoprotein-sorting protein